MGKDSVILVEAPIASYASFLYCTVHVQYCSSPIFRGEGEVGTKTCHVGMTQVSRFFMCGSDSYCVLYGALFHGRVSCHWLPEG